MSELFVKATKQHLKFPFRGQITTEDLWDLSLENLDDVYKDLKKTLEKESSDSLIHKKSKASEKLELAIEVVKFVVKTKLDEKAEKERAVAVNAERQQILSVIEEKKAAAYKDMSVEELEAKLAGLK